MEQGYPSTCAAPSGCRGQLGTRQGGAGFLLPWGGDAERGSVPWEQPGLQLVSLLMSPPYAGARSWGSLRPR